MSNRRTRSGPHCAAFSGSKRRHRPSYSQRTGPDPPAPTPSLSSLIPKRRLCHNVSLWQFNLIVTIECLWVAKGTISCSKIINSNDYWNLPMKDPCSLSLFVCLSVISCLSAQVSPYCLKPTAVSHGLLPPLPPLLLGGEDSGIFQAIAEAS